MRPAYALSLKPSLELRADGDDLLLAHRSGEALRLRNPGAATRGLIDRLRGAGGTAEELCGGDDPARLYYTLDTLAARGWLCRSAMGAAGPLATLEPQSPDAPQDETVPDGPYRLSRFAILRRDGEAMVVESPLGHAKVTLYDPAAVGLMAALGRPYSPRDAGEAALVGLLLLAGAAFPCGADGSLPEDGNPTLRQWDTHDLYYHSRSRIGRHDNPFGGTFRLIDQLPHLPPVKPAMSLERLPLPKPGPDTPSPAFFDVVERRKSVREPSDRPLRLDQLGTFLYHVHRIKEVRPVDLGKGAPYELTFRPCGGGGAAHPMELYLTVNRVDGLEPGFYHYDPQGHALERLSGLEAPHQQLLADACHATDTPQAPDLLITLAARFQRVSWKYEGMAYAVVLKDVGLLYQQMYLVATALGLSPCGIGSGNADLFAKLAGVDYFAETSVGEFMVSGG